MSEVKEKTPQEHAQAALESIRKYPEAFNMSFWYYTDKTEDTIWPEDNNLCGTTMCVAGWVAHNAGYRLAGSGLGNNGRWMDNRAIKGKEADTIEFTAQVLLGLTGNFAYEFFVMSELRAIQVLEFLADGEQPGAEENPYEFVQRCSAKDAERSVKEVMDRIADWADRQVPGE